MHKSPFTPDELEGKAYDGALMRRLLVYVVPHKRLVILAALFMAVSTCLELAIPYLAKEAIDRARAGDGDVHFAARDESQVAGPGVRRGRRKVDRDQHLSPSKRVGSGRGAERLDGHDARASRPGDRAGRAEDNHGRDAVAASMRRC